MSLQTIGNRLRWKTLSATLSPALVGIGLALRSGNHLSLLPFLSCGPCAFLIQIGTNLVNDALDYKNGVDGPKRLGPRRLSKQNDVFMFYLAGVACFPLALLLSLPAILIRGRALFAMEVLCCLAGYAYTGGPYPLGYHALGDLTVFVFFGIVATSNARFVLEGGSMFEVASIVAGSQVGCNAVNLLAVNNLRDIDQDSKSGKRTISNILGYEKGRWQLVALVVITHLTGLYWLMDGAPLAFALPLMTLPLALLLLRRIFVTRPSTTYNRYLAQFSMLHLLFSFTLMIGLSLSRLVGSL